MFVLGDFAKGCPHEGPFWRPLNKKHKAAPGSEKRTGHSSDTWQRAVSRWPSNDDIPCAASGSGLARPAHETHALGVGETP